MKHLTDRQLCKHTHTHTHTHTVEVIQQFVFPLIMAGWQPGGPVVCGRQQQQQKKKKNGVCVQQECAVDFLPN